MTDLSIKAKRILRTCQGPNSVWPVNVTFKFSKLRDVAAAQAYVWHLLFWQMARQHPTQCDALLQMIMGRALVNRGALMSARVPGFDVPVVYG